MASLLKSGTKKISIVVGTYNEVDNVLPLFEQIKKELDENEISFEMIVVDDNSPDGTSDKANDIASSNKELKVFTRFKDRGLAKSVIFGIRQSRNNLVLIMDGDLSHPPSDIVRLYEEMSKGYDMVWASRYVKDGNMSKNESNIFQFVLSLWFNYFLKYFLKLSVLDTTNGFFIFKKELLNGINCDEIFDGYGDFSFKLLYFLERKSKIKIKEIPTFYQVRINGQSKTKVIQVALLYLKESLKIKLNKFRCF